MYFIFLLPPLRCFNVQPRPRSSSTEQACRVVVFHLTKWHRLAAGNVRDASRTWWPRAFVSEPPFQDLEGGDMVHPPHEYYNLKGKAGEI